MEADALAIELAEGAVARTVEVGTGTLVDLDAAGRVLSIESSNQGTAGRSTRCSSASLWSGATERCSRACGPLGRRSSSASSLRSRPTKPSCR
ncbi:MAG: DUF2283 domain-containing protein [Thermoleophilia bacterium]|nr:DUF2283 domain-containing protein [Thermoleophilia bacterium]